MPKLPEPPPAIDLAHRLPARVTTLPAGSVLWRISFQDTAYPTSWASFRRYGPLLSARFDHHLPPPREQERGILCAATAILTCVAEVFQGRRLIDTRDRRAWPVGFRLRRDVCLLDLTGNWPTAALYERAGDSIDPSPIFHRDLGGPSLLDPLRRFAIALGYGLI